MEYGDGDWEFRFAISLSMVTLDPSDEALDNWGGAGLEREVEVSVHGFDVPEVLFNSPGLYFSAEAGDP